MDAERYRRIRELYLHASELAGAERDAFVDAIEDPGERDEVRRLAEAPAVETGALAPPVPPVPAFELPHDFGRYRLVGKLGEGGMGIVYEAEDPQLGRRVAIKTVRRAMTDATTQQRLLREARTAAGISHPHICQVYEVGACEETLFIAMELLEGESLAARLSRGKLPLGEALPVLCDVLAALQALHDRGVVHRDLKPSNVILTPHGVKLLDFGLARSFVDAPTGERLTQTGMFLGTPGFMAPEVFHGVEPGPAADLFAVGALAIEIITGVAAFRADTPAEGFHAVLHDQPPTLTGGPAVEAADRVVQQALSKRPEERPESAAAMADGLRLALELVDGRERPAATSFQRLLVVPFRLLQPDESISFLPLGLADALNTSLSGLEGLVVLSSHVGARYADSELDFARVARETEAQLVLTGTLLRGGDRLRAATQLLDASSGALVWSGTSEVAVDDIFRLQDDLARRIVDSLALKLAPGRKRLQSDVPASPAAYECFLRANQLAYNFGQLEQARNLYRRCLEADPNYAPAWAQLGRVYRVMAKYGHGDFQSDIAEADRAFAKALELSPNLSAAHHLYAYFQIEERGESKEAMVRLLELARRRPTDVQLLCGLVLACRFCGLLDASIEADRRARRLDPGVRTSVQYTYWAAGEYEKAIAHDDEDLGWVHYYALPLLGRADEAIALCRKRERRSLREVERALLESDRRALEGDRAACVEATARVLESSFHDPEGRYFCARALVHVGERDAGLTELASIVASGLYCDRALRIDPWWDSVRDEPRFTTTLVLATEGREAAAAAYRDAGGVSLLGPGLSDRRA